MKPLPTIDPDLLLRAYAVGVFPMAEAADSPILHWIDPERRGVLPLENFHLPKRLRRTVRQRRFEVRLDHDVAAIIDACGAPTPDRPQTWINPGIRAATLELARRGFAHSVESWADGALQGGLYGIALGGAFFGESMFSRATDASKVALVHLVARLRFGGFRLLDTQFLTEHLAQFGAHEIPRSVYRSRLAEAIASPARFYCGEEGPVLEALLGALLGAGADEAGADAANAPVGPLHPTTSTS